MYYPYSFGYMFYDKTYFLVIIGLIISMLAQANIQKAFSKYSKIKSNRGITGYQAAKYILDVNNYNDIAIKKIGGSLSDYFNPATKEVALSKESFTDTSIASIAVAAHECGHVIQYKEGYIPLRVKSWIVPAVNFGSKLAFPIILLGIFLSQQKLLDIGLILFSLVLIFQLVTLPVEFDASRRAIRVIDESGMLAGEELEGAKAMLKAAAYTYLAATLATALQFLRLFLLYGNRNNRRD